MEATFPLIELFELPPPSSSILGSLLFVGVVAFMVDVLSVRIVKVESPLLKNNTSRFKWTDFIGFNYFLNNYGRCEIIHIITFAFFYFSSFFGPFSWFSVWFTTGFKAKVTAEAMAFNVSSLLVVVVDALGWFDDNSDSSDSALNNLRRFGGSMAVRNYKGNS